MIGDDNKIFIDIAKKAGREILKYYDTEINFELKKDSSPVTVADLCSHQILISEISNISSYPIISEEDKKELNKNKGLDDFWLIDPLDGTKEFIAKSDEFTINIALIKNKEPVFGIIYAPIFDEMYIAEKNGGAYLFKDGTFIKLPINNIENQKKIIKSRRHISDKDLEFMKRNNIFDAKYMGSALKFAMLAKGNATIYPRFVGSSEWDIASGFIILKEVGGTIIDLETRADIKFNKPKFRNNNFIAISNYEYFSQFKYG